MGEEERSVFYDVTIRTTCRACALAIAGQSGGLPTVEAALVRSKEEDGTVIQDEYKRTPDASFYDGSPFACDEHGRVLDLSKEPASG